MAANRYTTAPFSNRGVEPTLGDAIERVYEAGQALLVRRIDLLSEEVARETRSALGNALETLVLAIIALAGWFFVVVGLVGALDERFPRAGVQVGVGLAHVAIAISILWMRRSRRREEK